MIISGKEISKKIFDRETHFAKDQRFIYVPDMEKTRKYLKVKTEANWLREKEEYKIDPTMGLADILTYKDTVYIRVTTHPSVAHTDFKLAETIATRLSYHGTAFVIYHKRVDSESRSNDIEIFNEIKSGVITTKKSKTQVNKESVFDWVANVYNIVISQVVESMDMAVEIQCAPYDLKEYRERLQMINEDSALNIGDAANIQLSEGDSEDTISAEINQERIEIEALIKHTEKLLTKNFLLDSVYFKASNSLYSV